MSKHMHNNPVTAFYSLQDLLEVKTVMKAVAWAMRQLVRASAVVHASDSFYLACMPHGCGPRLGRYAGPAHGEWHMRGAGAESSVRLPSNAGIACIYASVQVLLARRFAAHLLDVQVLPARLQAIAIAPFTTRGGEGFKMYGMPSGIPAYIFEGIIEPDIQSGAFFSCSLVALFKPCLA